jgi:hypothetical protein
MQHRSRFPEYRTKPRKAVEEDQDHQRWEQVAARTRRAAQLGARAAYLRQQAEWLEAEVQAELHQADLLIQEGRRRKAEEARQARTHQAEAAAAAVVAAEAARQVEEDLQHRNHQHKWPQGKRVRFRLPTDR